jgi:hypothetical protein
VYFLPPPLPTRIANNFQQRPAEEEILIDQRIAGTNRHHKKITMALNTAKSIS